MRSDVGSEPGEVAAGDLRLERGAHHCEMFSFGGFLLQIHHHELYPPLWTGRNASLRFSHLRYLETANCDGWLIQYRRSSNERIFGW